MGSALRLGRPGDSPLHPSTRGYPSRGDPGGVGARGNRGGPPRGVDVKPPRGLDFGTPKKAFLGSWDPFSPQNPVLGTSPPRTKPREPRKRAIIPHFGVFLAILGSRSPFWDPGSGGFTSTPRAGAPRSEKGHFRGTPGGEGFPAPRGGVGILVPWDPLGPQVPGPAPRGTAGPRREGLM